MKKKAVKRKTRCFFELPTSSAMSGLNCKQTCNVEDILPLDPEQSLDEITDYETTEGKEA